MNPNVPNDCTEGEARALAAAARRDAPVAILLVEDDPTTRAYLCEVLRAVPAEVATAAGVAEALQQAQSRSFALWLIDANLPDGTGVDLLRQLRSTSPATPALAHTAARDRGELQPLLQAGFDTVLTKPADAQAWLSSIRSALNGQASPSITPVPDQPAIGALPLWDDAAAARALGGNPENVRALRALFLAELPGQIAEIRSGDTRIGAQHLHRLRASCAFVGAARLEAAARVLHDAPGTSALQMFLDVTHDTLADVPGGASHCVRGA